MDGLYEGKTILSIAEELGISPKTASTHKAKLFAKLGVRNQTEFIKLIIKQREEDVGMNTGAN
jgi:DNA-binding CsgD family transcriptional regulator